MAVGVRIRDANGNIKLDFDDLTARIVYSELRTLSPGSGSQAVPGITEDNACGFVLNVQSSVRWLYSSGLWYYWESSSVSMPKVWISNGAINWVITHGSSIQWRIVVVKVK